MCTFILRFIWCLTCKETPKSLCQQESHIVVDWSEDVKEIGSMMASICSDYKTAITKRKDFQEHTDKTIEFLEKKLTELKTERATNQSYLNELCLSLENADLQMKDLTPSSDKKTVSFHSIRKILKKKMHQAKEDTHEADLLPCASTMVAARQLLFHVFLLTNVENQVCSIFQVYFIKTFHFFNRLQSIFICSFV